MYGDVEIAKIRTKVTFDDQFLFAGETTTMYVNICCVNAADEPICNFN